MILSRRRSTSSIPFLSSVVARSFTGAAAGTTPPPPELYFRQLSPGKDIALSAHDPAHQFARQMGNYIYLIGDVSTGECSVVDGAWDPEGIIGVARSDNMNITSHLATHYHWDHIGAAEKQGIRIPGLADWVETFGLPAFVPTWELEAAAEQVKVDEALLTPLSDGQCMALGRFGMEFIHTPGHSPGSMCIRVSNRLRKERATTNESHVADEEEVDDLLLITGDTVFPGSCGRLDLPDSDPLIMYDSLRKLQALPDDLPIYPGHSYGGASSTIGKEKTSGLLRSDITRAQWKQMMAR